MTTVHRHTHQVTEKPRSRPVPTQRPRQGELLGAGALIGGLAGGTLGQLASERSDDPTGLLLGAGIGGFLGALFASTAAGPLSLRQSLETELANRDLKLVSLRRAGPYKVSLAYRDQGGHVWVVDCEADTTHPWTQEVLDDWLFSALVSAVANEMEARHAT